MKIQRLVKRSEVHGDVKPQNVLLTLAEEGRPEFWFVSLLAAWIFLICTLKHGHVGHRSKPVPFDHLCIDRVWSFFCCLCGHSRNIQRISKAITWSLMDFVEIEMFPPFQQCFLGDSWQAVVGIDLYCAGTFACTTHWFRTSSTDARRAILHRVPGWAHKTVASFTCRSWWFCMVLCMVLYGFVVFPVCPWFFLKGVREAKSMEISWNWHFRMNEVPGSYGYIASEAGQRTINSPHTLLL